MTTNKQQPSSAQDNNSNYKVVVDGQSFIYHNSSQTLLESIETQNIEVHYHCRDGFCGACRVTLNTGTINYPQGDPLAYVGPNEILPCCCVPTSDIEITNG